MSVALSIVVPAYNEERRLGPTLARMVAWTRETGRACEIVVVDDGSRDRTPEVVAEAAAKWPEVRLLRQPANRGKGAAVRAGMLAAVGERVLFSDADLATPIEELGKLEAALDLGAAIAIGSRGLADSDIRTRQHPARELMGRTFNRLVRMLVLDGIRDTQCGFKLFRQDAAHALFGEAITDGFAFDVEILLLARGRYRVAEVPVVWHHVDESKVSPGVDAAKMLADIVRMRLRLARARR